MTGKKGLGSMFLRAMVILCAMVLSSQFLEGCTKSVPKCDSDKAVTDVGNAVGQAMKKDLSGIAGGETPGGGLTEDEWKAIRSEIFITVENIREQGYDEGAGKRSCAANVVVNQDRKKSITVTYTEELNKDTGEVKTKVSGLAKAKEAESALPQVPKW